MTSRIYRVGIKQPSFEAAFSQDYGYVRDMGRARHFPLQDVYLSKMSASTRGTSFSIRTENVIFPRSIYNVRESE